MDLIASFVNFLSLIPTTGALYSICMLFKRKAEDILPEKYTKSAMENDVLQKGEKV